MSSVINSRCKCDIGSKILLVDDQDSVRDSLYALLEASGYEVLAANNGPDGLRICQQSTRPIELLVTDCNMPQMSGLELARECIRLYREIRVLYVSGSDPDDELREELQEHRRGFLAKPFRGSDLLRKTRELLLAESTGQVSVERPEVTPSAHNHGREYQLKVIHADGTEAVSEWIEHVNVARTMAALRKPQARAFWLRERNVAVAACPLCRNRKTAIAEYPLTDWLSPRSRPQEAS